ncbi:MAG: 2-oxoglutarate dehydrogenase complex dihydrolipoyllysine-residue succinyltransferase [Bacteroidota bacterium]
MLIEIKIPSPGESINNVQLSALLVKNGDYVEKDAEIAEIDSDKATLPVFASESGIIKFFASEGDTIQVGSTLCIIDSSASISVDRADDVKVIEPVEIISKPEELIKPDKLTNQNLELNISPLARLLLADKNISELEFIEKLKHIRLSKKEISDVLSKPLSSDIKKNNNLGVEVREVERKKMSTLRLKLSERLVAAKNQTAMLTTFNEINMQALIKLRSENKDAFKEKHGVSLGYMSFFTKAASIALTHYPIINSQIDSGDILSFNYSDISIAVSTPKGLMVPVVKNANSKSIPVIEKTIFELAQKAKNNRISIEELTGGTFTITNGGVFGSLLSTPIINSPQSAILGMHNIVDRPIAVNGKVEIAPMMYIALSYDHRVIDGKDSVAFLIKIKELIEQPENLLIGSSNSTNLLLEI